MHLPVAVSVLLAITAARSEHPLPTASVSAVVVTLMVVASAAGAVSAKAAECSQPNLQIPPTDVRGGWDAATRNAERAAREIRTARSARVS